MIHTDAELQEFVSRVALPAGWSLRGTSAMNYQISDEGELVLSLDMICSPMEYDRQSWPPSSVVWCAADAVAPCDGRKLLESIVRRAFGELATRVTVDGSRFASVVAMEFREYA